MDLCTISKREDVSIKVPVLVVLFNIVAEPDNNGSVVPFELTVGLRVVRCREDVLDYQDLAVVCWKNLDVNCFPLSDKSRRRGP